MKTTDFLELVQPMVLNQGFTKPGARKPTGATAQPPAAIDGRSPSPALLATDCKTSVACLNPPVRKLEVSDRNPL